MKLLRAITDLIAVHGACDAFQLAIYMGVEPREVVDELLLNTRLYNLNNGRIISLNDGGAIATLREHGRYIRGPYEHDYYDVKYSIPRFHLDTISVKMDSSPTVQRIAEFWEDIVIYTPPTPSNPFGDELYSIEETHRPLLEELGFVFENFIYEAWREY